MNRAMGFFFFLKFPHFQLSQPQIRTFGIMNPPKLSIGVQGIPFDLGQPKSGASKGPEVIRESGVFDFLKNLGHDVKDYGDLELDSKRDPNKGLKEMKLKNLAQVASCNKKVHESVVKILREGKVCLNLGGDHSIGIGTLSGAAEVHPDLGILWVDAHADINSPQSTWTGNMHGMPVSFLLKEHEGEMEIPKEFSWLKNKISAKKIAYIGLRDVDPSERALIDKEGILAFSMPEIDKLGIEEVVRLSLERISPNNSRPIHVSFDIDALDDLEVPNTGTPVPGGLTLREGQLILEGVYKTGKMVSMDLVEINPELGTERENKRTGLLSNFLLSAVFGYYRGGMGNEHAKHMLNQTN